MFDVMRPIHSDRPGLYGVSFVDHGKWLFTSYYRHPPYGSVVRRQEQRFARAIKAGWGKKFSPIVLVRE